MSGIDYMTRDYITFPNEEKARRRVRSLKRRGMVIWRCKRCGTIFSCRTPDMSDAGVVCQICADDLAELEARQRY